MKTYDSCKRKNLRRRLMPAVSTAAITLSLMGAGFAAQAQDAEPAAQPEADNTEVIVTAQRRNERLQTVPITVTALSATNLQQRGISATTDLPMAAPGVTLMTQFGFPMFFVRGVGTSSNVGGNESSNAFYIDGVYMPDMPGALMSFNNIERLEILKGPQGTLFGRNATGGLIQIITKNPTRRQTDLSVGYASYDRVEAQAYLSAGNYDAAADLAIHYHDQGEGWGKNIANGEDFYKDKAFAIRSKQVFNLSDVTRLTTSVFYSETESDISSGRQLLPGALGTGGTPYTGEFYNVNYNSPAFSKFSGGGANATVTHDMPWASFLSITSWQKNSNNFMMDQDSTPVFAVMADVNYSNTNFSQEFQLQSPESSALKWVAGVFLFTATNDLDRLTVSGAAFNALGGYKSTFSSQKTTSIAAYGQVTHALGPKTNLTGGLRFTQEKREFEADSYSPVVGRGDVTDTEKTWSSWTYRLSADHHFTQNVMGYASYNRGFKSGVYNLLTPANPVANPEILDAYEAGLKTRLFDGRLLFNTSVFKYDYQDMQLNSTELGVSYVINAAQADIKGVDVEVLYSPMRNLAFRAQAEWLDATYKSFPSAPMQIPNPATCTPTPTTTGPVTGGNLSCVIDASGNRLVNSPELTYTLGANYRWNTPIGSMTGDISYSYSDRVYFLPDNRLSQDPYGLLNASLSLSFGEGRYSLRLWGKNLGDERYYANMTTGTGDMFAPGAPRTVGVTLQSHF